MWRVAALRLVAMSDVPQLHFRLRQLFTDPRGSALPQQDFVHGGGENRALKVVCNCSCAAIPLDRSVVGTVGLIPPPERVVTFERDRARPPACSETLARLLMTASSMVAVRLRCGPVAEVCMLFGRSSALVPWRYRLGRGSR
jgi:hypothetical protein